MTFSSSGSYTQVAGAVTAAAGQTIQSATWDAVHTDFGNVLSQLGACLVTAPAPRNILSANGGCEMWQRGAGTSASISVLASTTQYTADRWYITTGANQASTVSAQTGLQAGSQLCAQVQRNNGATGVTAMTFGYPLDTDEVMRMRGQKVSLSFYAATGANWSPASGTLTATLYVGTGAVAKRGGGFTGETSVLAVSGNVAAGSSATLLSGLSSAAVPSNATQGELQFTWTPTGMAGANDWFQIDDVMLGSGPAPGQGFVLGYERLPFAYQLLECRRHFWKSFAYGTAPAQNAGLGTGEIKGMAGKAGAAAELLWTRNPVSMRATPGTVTLYNPSAANAQVRDETAGADCSASTAAQTSTEGLTITATGNASTAVGNILSVHLAVDAGI
jgi:hypothetical protein